MMIFGAILGLFFNPEIQGLGDAKMRSGSNDFQICSLISKSGVDGSGL